MSFVPKQSLQNNIRQASQAAADFASKVEISVTERVASEGSVISVKVGDEKDGFKSLSMSVDKGQGTEGPIVATITENVNGATVKKTVSVPSKLQGITGKATVEGEVLNESICQGSVKGMASTLKDVIKMDPVKVESALKDASPIPSKAKAAIKKENAGGVAKNIASETVKASKQVSTEIKNPFGSLNKFGSIGSSIGNILGQVTAIASNAKRTYNNPTSALPLTSTPTLLNEDNIRKPTPDIITNTGKSNLKNVVTKSATTNTKVKSTEREIIVGQNDPNWKGVNTRLTLEGGSYRFETLQNETHIEAEFRNIEREVTNLVFWHIGKKRLSGFTQSYHMAYRRNNTRKYGADALNANPFAYGIPAHIFIYSFAEKITPFNLVVPNAELREGKKKTKYDGTIAVAILAEEESDIGPLQWQAIESIMRVFLRVFPGGEVIGLKDITSKTSLKNNPDWDVKQYALNKFGKDSTLPDDADGVPSASELADRKPYNIALPSNNVGRLPNVNDIIQKANPPTDIPVSDYENQLRQISDFTKQRNDMMNLANLTSGNGLAGAFKGNVLRFDNIANSATKVTQALKMNQLKENKIFSAVSKTFEKITDGR